MTTKQKKNLANKIEIDSSNSSILKNKKLWLYILGISIVFCFSFSYTFDKKPDVNGDASFYYMLSKSITDGHGYKNIGNVDMKPTNLFPPGYPILMSAIMIFTDSIVPQKILNGIFLLLAALIIFHWMRKVGKSTNLGFVTAVIILLNWLVLKFATVMMSEMSFILFSSIALYLLTCLNDDKKFFKDKYFYLLIFVAAYAMFIRTQGITLAAAILFYFLINKKWWHSAGFLAGVILLSLPWSIRNSLVGIDGNRYIQHIFWVNPWRPEEGFVTIPQLIKRGFETTAMLISQALPNSIYPYVKVNYNETANFWGWALGISQLGVISIGFWQFKKYKAFFFGYLLAVGAILFGWSAPSENRYITTLIPFLEIGLIVGIHTIMSWLLKKMKLQLNFSPLILLILCVFAFPQLEKRREIAKAQFAPNYTNYLSIAKQMDRKDLHDKVVCSRKESVFYVYAKTFVCGYEFTTDRKKLIEGLITNKVDYVVLEQLGYSSTGLYLHPAIQNNMDLFETVIHLKDPDTYLFHFKRDIATEKVKNDEIK